MGVSSSLLIYAAAAVLGDVLLFKALSALLAAATGGLL